LQAHRDSRTGRGECQMAAWPANLQSPIALFSSVGVNASFLHFLYVQLDWSALVPFSAGPTRTATLKLTGQFPPGPSRARSWPTWPASGTSACRPDRHAPAADSARQVSGLEDVAKTVNVTDILTTGGFS
jgi:hypothetical protein